MKPSRYRYFSLPMLWETGGVPLCILKVIALNLNLTNVQILILVYFHCYHFSLQLLIEQASDESIRISYSPRELNLRVLKC